MADNTAARTVRVHLADAPTDVLVWLADNPGWWRLADLEAAVPDDVRTQGAHSWRAALVNAVRLLQECGYAHRAGTDLWEATEAGRAAVEEARAHA